MQRSRFVYPVGNADPYAQVVVFETGFGVSPALRCIAAFFVLTWEEMLTAGGHQATCPVKIYEFPTHETRFSTIAVARTAQSLESMNAVPPMQRELPRP